MGKTKIEELRKLSRGQGTSVRSVFRQLVSQGGIKLSFLGVSVELREADLQRVHNIINEIDERRAFYDDLGDEIPQHLIDSVLDAKKAINELRRGLWANLWARQQIAQLLHDLGDFLTKTQHRKVPRYHHDQGFEEFAKAALELRLKIWTTVAHLVVAFGEQVSAMHMPTEILADVQKAYDSKT